jgi:hypothetical protein
MPVYIGFDYLCQNISCSDDQTRPDDDHHDYNDYDDYADNGDYDEYEN